MTKEQIYKKFTNLRQEKLNTRDNKKTLFWVQKLYKEFQARKSKNDK